MTHVFDQCFLDFTLHALLRSRVSACLAAVHPLRPKVQRTVVQTSTCQTFPLSMMRKRRCGVYTGGTALIMERKRETPQLKCCSKGSQRLHLEQHTHHSDDRPVNSHVRAEQSKAGVQQEFILQRHIDNERATLSSSTRRPNLRTDNIIFANML